MINVWRRTLSSILKGALAVQALAVQALAVQALAVQRRVFAVRAASMFWREVAGVHGLTFLCAGVSGCLCGGVETLPQVSRSEP